MGAGWVMFPDLTANRNLSLSKFDIVERENWLQDVFKYKYRHDIYEYRYTCKCIYIQIHYATTHANGEVTARHSIYLTSLHLYIQRLNRNNNHV